jgi:hypothetical protein
LIFPSDIGNSLVDKSERQYVENQKMQRVRACQKMTFQQEKRAKIFHSASKKASFWAFSYHFVALLRFSTFCPQKIHKKSTAKRRGSRRKKSSVARVFSLSTKHTAPTTHTTKSFFHIHSFILFSRVKKFV